ncbi:MAG: hypothetical protein C0403_14410 [Desulfobacterium sp.]|nr:hypothetical protein [Desulfobacterium sp.]
MRAQLSPCPITVQQCYALESLMEGHKSMNSLAEDVAIHQSTLTRIVEKLEKQGLVTRTRKTDNQRMVTVQITETGKQIHDQLYQESLKIIATLLDQVPTAQHETLVGALETVVNLIDPENQAFRSAMEICCATNIIGDILPMKNKFKP